MAIRACPSLLSTSSRVWHRTSGNWNPHRSSRRQVASSVSREDVKPSPSIQKSKLSYRIQTAVLLNRSPILTRPLSSFEAAHYEYNARIGRALFNPFPIEFYFKAGSLLENQFLQEERRREKEAFRWDRHSPGDSDTNGEKGEGGSSALAAGVIGKEEEVQIMPRLTEADRKNDVRSLDRKGHRNLYLLVKKGKGRNEWRLPGGVGEIQSGELLHEAAKRELHVECGVNMDVWIVGRHPIAFMDNPLPPDSPLSQKYLGAKTFFLKGHILAGQVNPAAGSLADFAWFTKREVKRAVTPEYWTHIRDIMSDF